MAFYPVWGASPSGSSVSWGDRLGYWTIGQMPENGTLDRIEVWTDFSDATARSIRVALYKGGASATDISGATLVEDLGEWTPGSSGGSWLGIDSTTNPSLTSGDYLIVGLKSQTGSGGTIFVEYESSDPSNGALPSATFASDESLDETDVWDASITNPSDVPGSRWGGVRIEYTATSSLSIPVAMHHYNLMRNK